MAFSFRLQKVLDYRGLLENDAKQKYMDCRASRIEGEKALVEIAGRRRVSSLQEISSLVGYVEIQAQMMKYDDDEVLARAALGVLTNEEEAAELVWRACKQDLETMEKLRERALDEWNVEETRREQAELDEWVVMRRAA